MEPVAPAMISAVEVFDSKLCNKFIIISVPSPSIFTPVLDKAHKHAAIEETHSNAIFELGSICNSSTVFLLNTDKRSMKTVVSHFSITLSIENVINAKTFNWVCHNISVSFCLLSRNNTSNRSLLSKPLIARLASTSQHSNAICSANTNVTRSNLALVCPPLAITLRNLKSGSFCKICSVEP